MYQSDLLLAAPSITRSLNSPVVVYHIRFLINFPKSIVHPTQQMKFLGFMVDTTTTMMIALPPYRVEEIQKEATQLCIHQIRTPAHFIGALVASELPVPPGSQDLKIQALHYHLASYQSRVDLSHEA